MSQSRSTDRPLWSPSEWWDDLSWPRVARAAALGVRAGRIGLAVFGLLPALLLVGVFRWLDRQIVGGGGISWPVGDGPTGVRLLTLPWRWAVEAPISAVSAAPLTTLIAGPLALVIALVVVAAIARSIAAELSWKREIGWTEALGFAASRWRSLLGAVLGPLVLVWLLSAVVAIGGLLLRVPGLDVAAALGFLVALVVGLVSFVVLAGLVIGWWLSVLAIVCDGADALDAVQRSLAYIVGKPVRLVVYAGVGFATAWALMVVVTGVALGAVGLSAHAAASLAGESGQAVVRHAVVSGLQGAGAAGEAPGSTGGVAAGVMTVWVRLVVLVVIGAWVAVLTGAATGAYLAIRRAVDGLDMDELHDPGRIEAGMKAAMAARAKAGGTGSIPAGPLPGETGRGDEA